jgi:quercetin 2,3-dioxygenase
MEIVFHPANHRGRTEIDWLKSSHSFSFGDYYDPTRHQFGALRVLNDDWIKAGHGFDTHPHNNMEIVTILLSGRLKHKDTLGNEFDLDPGDIQVMSAGTGIYHSEYSGSSDRPTELLQLWILPKHRNTTPRYSQKKFEFEVGWTPFIQPLDADIKQTGLLDIGQECWFTMGNFEAGETPQIPIQNSLNGVYCFVIAGSVLIEAQTLATRDALGIIHPNPETVITIRDRSTILCVEIPIK